MTKSNVLEYDITAAANNSDIGGINILGTAPVSNFDNALRELMLEIGTAVTRHVTKAAGSYTAVKADHNQLWRATGAATFNLTAAATLTTGWALYVKADGGAITIDPNGAETINGAATLTIDDGVSALIICTGTAFFAIRFGNVTLTGTETLTNKTLTGAAINGTLGATTPSTVAATTGAFSGVVQLSTGSQAAPALVDTLNTDLGMYFPADASVAFGVDNVHIGRFSSDGVHISKTSGSLSTTGHSLFTSGLFQMVRDHNICGQFNVINPVGTETIVEFMTSGTAKGSVTINGSTTAYNTTSDRRLKENPRPFDAGAILDKLKVYQFDWKTGGSGFGVFAQEAVRAFPDAITKGKRNKMWQVDYSKFVPLLLREVQNLRKEIAGLKSKI